MKKVLLVTYYVAFIALCIVFCKYDLEISKALTKHSNAFFEFFEYYGELPIYIWPVLFGSTFFFLNNKKFNKIICAIMVLGIYTFAITRVIHNKHIDYNALNLSLSLVGGIALSLLTLFAFSKIKLETLNSIKDLVFFGLVIMITSVFLVWVFKNIWGRVRFRDLSDDYNEFTKVYRINGPTGNESFPSGHTNAATSVLLIPLFVRRLASKKWKQYVAIAVCLAYICVLGIARIFVGAHYASDVLCGFTVSFTLQWVIYYFMKRKGVINVASDKC